MTICVHDHECVLGEIKNGVVQLTSVGEIVRKYWVEIPGHYPQVSVDEFVVMPNHIHGVIMIHEEEPASLPGTESQLTEPQQPFSPRDVELQSLYESRPSVRQYHQYQHIIPKSVGSIVRAYKSAVTLWCRKNGYSGFRWQRNF